MTNQPGTTLIGTPTIAAATARTGDLEAVAEALFTGLRIARQSKDYDTLRARFPDRDISLDPDGEPFVALEDPNVDGWQLRYYVSPVAEIWDDTQQRGAIRWPHQDGHDAHLAFGEKALMRTFRRWLTEHGNRSS